MITNRELWLLAGKLRGALWLLMALHENAARTPSPDGWRPVLSGDLVSDVKLADLHRADVKQIIEWRSRLATCELIKYEMHLAGAKYWVNASLTEVLGFLNEAATASVNLPVN